MKATTGSGPGTGSPVEPELELTFVDLVPVNPKPESHLEILVPAIRTGTVRPEFRFKPKSQLELKY